MTTDINLNRSNWVFDIKFKTPKGENPDLFNALTDAKWQLKINIGTNFFDPQTCNQCRQKTKILLRWYMLIGGSTESSEIYCYKCGSELITSIQQGGAEKMASMAGIEILTKNYKEYLQEIKENFDEINIEYKDKQIV